MVVNNGHRTTAEQLLARGARVNEKPHGLADTARPDGLNITDTP